MTSGFLNVLKPPGLTSHDVVSDVRKLCGDAKVGHVGTLDPAAAGVLLVAVGPATRLAQYLETLAKSYRAVFTFGITTDSADAEGTVTRRKSASGVTEEAVTAALAELTGEISMVPPAYSAVHVGGRRAYELARKGHEVVVPARTVHVSRLQMLRFTGADCTGADFTDGEFPEAVVDVECSKGTYVRSLAVMAGERLGCGAYLSGLVRTAVGPHRLEAAATIAELAGDGVAAHLISPSEALAHLPAVSLEEAEVEAVRHGRHIPGRGRGIAGEMTRLVDATGHLIAVAECVDDAADTVLRPRTVLPKSQL